MSLPFSHAPTGTGTHSTASTHLVPTTDDDDNTSYTSESYTSLTTPAGTTERHTHTDPSGTIVTESHQPQASHYDHMNGGMNGGWVEQTALPAIEARPGVDGVMSRQGYVDPDGAVVMETRQPYLPTQVQAQTSSGHNGGGAGGGGWAGETPYQPVETLYQPEAGMGHGGKRIEETSYQPNTNTNTNTNGGGRDNGYGYGNQGRMEETHHQPTTLNGGRGWVEQTPAAYQPMQEEHNIPGSFVAAREEERILKQEQREAERVQRDGEKEREVDRRYREAMEEEYAKREGGA